MKKIGQILKNARTEKNYTYQKLEQITKIRSSFIEAVENEEWQKLPPFATVLGFVKSISSVLDVDEKLSVAILKRDYPPKKINVNPKPDVFVKQTWSPKLTFITGIVVVIIVILGYLVFQYVNFISPPKIEVTSPVEGQVISGNSVLVFGSTDTDAKITVDNQPVLVGDDGKFSTNIEISAATTDIFIKAVGRSGKETTIDRKIKVQ